MSPIDVRQYQTAEGRVPVSEWLCGLRDTVARDRITIRLDRLAAGLRGDWRSVGCGVTELRIDHGPGYRVHFAQHASTVVLLLCGGDKDTQTRDIERAHAYWKDYKARGFTQCAVARSRSFTH